MRRERKNGKIGVAGAEMATRDQRKRMQAMAGIAPQIHKTQVQIEMKIMLEMKVMLEMKIMLLRAGGDQMKEITGEYRTKQQKNKPMRKVIVRRKIWQRNNLSPLRQGRGRRGVSQGQEMARGEAVRPPAAAI